MNHVRSGCQDQHGESGNNGSHGSNHGRTAGISGLFRQNSAYDTGRNAKQAIQAGIEVGLLRRQMVVAGKKQRITGDKSKQDKRHKHLSRAQAHETLVPKRFTHHSSRGRRGRITIVLPAPASVRNWLFLRSQNPHCEQRSF